MDYAISLTSKFPKLGTTIFTTMSALAGETGAINLSQGFPDYACDSKLLDLVTQYMKKGMNQYAPMPGALPLRERLAEKSYNLYQAEYHPEKEITITAGATQGIFTAIAATIRRDDEVIVFDPAYDCYVPAIELFGGVPRYVELNPPDYKIDWEAVKKLISNKTKMIIINSPHNPTGAIVKEDDIKALIKIIKNTDILILSDEVYEHLTYDGNPHLSMAEFPELRVRSFIIASFGKLFHNTGWKMGYVQAPENLMKEFRKIHQFVVFSVNTPVQYAIADYIKDEQLYLGLSAFFEEKRDTFRSLMQETRFTLLPCGGSYFQLARYDLISNEKDVDFAVLLTKEFGVATIPVSAFYARNTDHKVLRFCFAKKQETLEKAVEKLRLV